MTTKTETKDIEKRELSVSERFTQMIFKEFSALSGNGFSFTQEQKTLAQHLFVIIDSELQKAETDRQEKGKKDKLPVIWANVNMQKLAKDAVHRINLGLDAFIENHIHIVPYFINNDKKYHITLSIGYIGMEYYRCNMAIKQPKDIRYELVYENDIFKPIKKDINHEIESYQFEIPKPFDRGEIVGGFGYISYEDPTENKLIELTKKDFKKAEDCAPSKKFWTTWPERQCYKTIVRRTTAKIPPDPKKINQSYLFVEKDDQEEMILQEIEENANKTPIDILSTELENEQEQAEETEQKTATENKGPDF